MPFNEQALRLYLENLEGIDQTLKADDARMGLIIWPTFLSPELLDDPDIYRALVGIYTGDPLSTRELWVWYNRYVGAPTAICGPAAGNHPG